MSLMRLPAAGEENWCFGKGGTLPQGSSACTMGSASDPLEGESAEESGNGFCSSMGRKKREKAVAHKVQALWADSTRLHSPYTACLE